MFIKLIMALGALQGEFRGKAIVFVVLNRTEERFPVLEIFNTFSR